MIALRAKNEVAAPPGTAGWAAPRQAVLRNVLVAADAVAVATTWLVVLGPLGAFHGSTTGLVVAVGSVTVATLAFMASQQLYLARVCRLRSLEVSRLLRVSVVAGALVHLVGPRWGVAPSAALAAAAVAAMALSLTMMRGIYTAWLRRRRSDGRTSGRSSSSGRATRPTPSSASSRATPSSASRRWLP